MKPLVTKKYIFERILAGKPIVIDMMTTELRQRYAITRDLFYETGVFKKLEPDEDGRFNHGRDTAVAYCIHVIVPKGGQPFVNEIKAGHEFAREVYGQNDTHHLP